MTPSCSKNIPGEPGKDYPIFGTNILCKINPQNPGCGGGAKPRSGRQNSDYEAAIARGEIPGTPGKDYPVNSVAAWRKRPGYENIELAPASLIVPGYPGLDKLPTSTRKLPKPANKPNGSGGGGNRRSSPRSQGGNRKSGGQRNQQNNGGSGGSYCPGGSIEACIGFCPSDDDGSEYGQCVSDCGKNC